MAIDTENKRRSVQGYTGVPMFPLADGSITGTDKNQIIGLYSGIAAIEIIGEVIGFDLLVVRLATLDLERVALVVRDQEITRTRSEDGEVIRIAAYDQELL